MDGSGRQALLEAILARAAERIGDITPAVMALFYARHPQALTAFETLWPGSRDRLEGEMVERVLYCLMYWFDSPGEIEILLIGSVPHHKQTLHVPPEWYGGLLEATMDVIGELIPADRADEGEVWATLRRELMEVIATGSSFA